MPSGDLVVTLRSLAERAQDVSDMKDLNPESFRATHLSLTHVADMEGLEAFGRSVCEALGWDSRELIEFKESPGSTSGIRPRVLAGMLVARARSQGAEAVLTEFFALVAANTIQVSEVHVLWGVTPATPVSLTEDVMLIPLSEAPPSTLRDSYLGIPERLDQSPPPPHAVIPRPGAALVRRLDHGPIFGPKIQTDRSNSAATEKMLDIVRVLTALLRRPIFPLADGYVLDTSAPLMMGGGYGGQGVQWAFQGATEPEELDKVTLSNGVAAFLAADESLRRDLRTALERLRTAFIHSWHYEQAMDLGIALEATLFAGDTSTYQGELRYRFKLRGTLVLGGSAAARRANADLLNRLYNLRSRVAHGGRLDQEDRVLSDLINQGLDLCCRLVHALVLRGSTPDWDGLAMGWETPAESQRDTASEK